MGTRAMFGVLYRDGRVRGAYCGHDGYPEHLGKVLSTRYTTLPTIEALLDRGDVCALHEELDESTFYNEDGSPAIIYESARKFLRAGEDRSSEYEYLFSERDNAWKVVESADGPFVYLRDFEEYCGLTRINIVITPTVTGLPVILELVEQQGVWRWYDKQAGELVEGIQGSSMNEALGAALLRWHKEGFVLLR